MATITSKIIGTPKGVNLLISKVHSSFAVTNLFAHNISLCYYGQVNLLGLKWSVYLRNGQSNTFGGTVYFAGDGTLGVNKFY